MRQPASQPVKIIDHRLLLLGYLLMLQVETAAARSTDRVPSRTSRETAESVVDKRVLRITVNQCLSSHAYIGRRIRLVGRTLLRWRVPDLHRCRSALSFPHGSLALFEDTRVVN